MHRFPNPRSNDDSMSGGWLFKVVPFFIVAVFLIVICWFIFLGVMARKAVNVMEDCTPAVVITEANGEKQYTVGCKK
jgi:hypothetical protein